MNPEKAIEILSTYRAEGYHDVIKGFDDSLKLGIEALKRRLEYNHKNLIDFSTLLPGETKD